MLLQMVIGREKVFSYVKMTILFLDSHLPEHLVASPYQAVA
jgi:hypothetical protein